MLHRNDPCWCGSGKKWKKCHTDLLPNPTFEDLQKKYYSQYNIVLKNAQQIQGIRRASQLAAKILDALCRAVSIGTTTLELNRLALQLHKDLGVTPAPLGYGDPPFPAAICTSVNDVICHGIPNSTPLKNGDILNIDVTVISEGYYGDCSRMVEVGRVSHERKKLIRVTEECLQKAIALVRPGLLLCKLGECIHHVATTHGFSVVDQFVGHGIGLEFHEAPQVLHHLNHHAIPLIEGMTFTIEPMINRGGKEGWIDRHDQWTARTKDGSDSAQCEHTVLVTNTGVEILTLPPHDL